MYWVEKAGNFNTQIEKVVNRLLLSKQERVCYYPLNRAFFLNEKSKKTIFTSKPTQKQD